MPSLVWSHDCIEIQKLSYLTNSGKIKYSYLWLAFIIVGISQQEDFTQWARLTRKKQSLEKMAKTEAEKSAQNAQESSFNHSYNNLPVSRFVFSLVSL